MRIHQLYRWVYARLWAFLLAAVIAVSGCATIEGYKNDEVKFDLQNQRNNDLVRQYSKDISELNARQMAYEESLANEARLKDENTRFRLNMAKAESALNSEQAAHAQQPAPAFAFKELGRIITTQTYELVLKELDDYSNLENLYNNWLKVLSLFQNGSPEYIREAEIIRAQALLDVISEAIVTANIPREALQESTLADGPNLEQALITLANAQDQMLIALNDSKLRGPYYKSNRSNSIAQSSCVDMLAAITDLMNSQNSVPLPEGLIVRLKTMHTVTEVTKILLSTINDLLNSSTSPEGRLLVAKSLKDYPFLAELLSYLTTMRDINAVNMGQPTNSAIRILNRMEWILTISTYCQGDAFKPDTYLQMRRKEIKPLKAATIEIIESYKLAHAQP
jgi:hypothetical protein